MSIIKKINNSSTEGEIFQILEEQVLDIETSLSWGEEAAVLEKNGEKDKAEILRAAEKRCIELNNQ